MLPTILYMEPGRKAGRIVAASLGQGRRCGEHHQDSKKGGGAHGDISEGRKATKDKQDCAKCGDDRKTVKAAPETEPLLAANSPENKKNRVLGSLALLETRICGTGAA